MRRNLLFGMLVVAVFALKLCAQANAGEVGWVDQSMTMNQELAGFIMSAMFWGLIFGAIRVAQTNARAQQALATKLLGL